MFFVVYAFRILCENLKGTLKFHKKINPYTAKYAFYCLQALCVSYDILRYELWRHNISLSGTGPWSGQWQYDSRWRMTHGLRLAGIILSWLVGLNICEDCPVLQCVLGSPYRWEFPLFSEANGHPLHSPGRQMSAATAVQGDCERV